jgi:hypothetical protein
MIVKRRHCTVFWPSSVEFFLCDLLKCTRHVQKVSSDRAYRSRRWRERGAPARWCFRSREGYIRYIAISHSLFIRSPFWLEMSRKLENPASCEIRSVIKNFNAKNVRLAEIYRHVCEVYRGNTMNDGMVRRWGRMFSEGRTNVHDDDRSGRPSLITADLLDQVNVKIWDNRNIYIFLHLKRFLAAERFSSDDEVKTAVQHWVKTSADFFDEGI